MDEDYKNLKIAENGARISIIAYIILSMITLTLGYFYHSKALIANGINNSTDIIASLAIIIGLKISKKPADDDHAYGHLRAQTISSLVASIIMIGVGLDVIYNAVYSTIFLKNKAPDMISAVVAIICAILIYAVYVYNKRVALRINSSALMAAAKDNLSDAWVGMGTAAGIIASQFGFPWIDPLAAVLVGILICKTGGEIFKEAAHNLADGFDSKQLDSIVSKIKEIDGVSCVKGTKARVHGNNILIDIVIGVNSKLTVVKSHEITEEIEEMLNREFKIKHAIIHVEPDSK
ncbi:cation diffusion facilitator family transporter [Clostridium ljungdahlii]|uniref:Ferrous-iron efflux pump FieF n=1 Tax=Clostridium ljungdahlii TaxID=1538 RepID=A0A162L3V6_9CLOT|nr:cation diffusion facilitator family transporter [Clostridium ljungdahlii]OAA83998.1 Ferrous-iron efflux pump FieF [Clostridium ljungdahlii]